MTQKLKVLAVAEEDLPPLTDDKQTGKYQALYQRKYLGLFTTQDAAEEAIKQAQIGSVNER